MTHPLIEEYRKNLEYFQKFYRMNLGERGSFQGFLRKFHFEDERILKTMENILREKRGYSFNLPRPGEPVILICSGGFDSIALWGIMLEKLKLHVYPLHFTSQRFKENQAFDYFYNFYKKRYDTLVGPVHYFDYPVSFQFYTSKTSVKNTEKDPDFFLANLIHKDKYDYNLTLMNPAARMGLFAFKTLEYALFLNYEKNIRMKTIFIGIMPEDGIFTNESTLTVLRSINVSICQVTGDYTWQFSSPSLEAESGYFFLKTDLATFCQINEIPIEYSWSCTKNYLYHCGECLGCVKRKQTFSVLGFTDKTVYHSPYPKFDIRLNWGIKRYFQKLKGLMYTKLSTVNNKYTAQYLSFHKNDVFKVKDNILYKKMNNKILIIDGKDKEKNLVVLNDTASDIFLLLKQKAMGIDELCKELIKKYQIGEKRLYHDVRRYINQELLHYLDVIK